MGQRAQPGWVEGPEQEVLPDKCPHAVPVHWVLPEGHCCPQSRAFLPCFPPCATQGTSRYLIFLAGLSGVCERDEAGLEKGDELGPVLFHN